MKPKFGFLLLIIQMVCVSIFSIIYIEYNQIDTWSSLLNLNIYDLSTFEDFYFPSFSYFNTFSFGLICAWFVKNNVKPKIIVGFH